VCIAPWANYEETSTVALACDLSFAELNEKQFLNTAPWLNSNFQQGNIRSRYLEIFCKFAARSYTPIPKMPAHHISTICTRPLGRIDNVALKRVDPDPAARRTAVLHRRWLRARDQRLREFVELCKRL
jgi:hypothetical protein